MDTKAVEKLRFIGGHQACQARDICCFWIGNVGFWCVANGLQNRHALQNAGHVFQGRSGIQTMQAQSFRNCHHRFAVAVGQSLDQLKNIGAVSATQHVLDRFFFQLAASEGNGLVGQTQGVTHGAAGGTGDKSQGLGFCFNRFLLQHTAQMR